MQILSPKSCHVIIRPFILPHIQKLDENSNYDVSIFRYGLKQIISFMQKKGFIRCHEVETQ